MRAKSLRILLLGTIFLILCAAANSGNDEALTLPMIDIRDSENGIVSLPASVPAVFTDVFVKHTKVLAPNGMPIHILAQAGWTDEKILKVRNILEHMLTDFPGPEYGSDKTAVANAMADRKAAMILFENSEESRKAMRGPLRDSADLEMQSMWANEITAEGSDDYMNHITRDAAYEEIWHLVHEGDDMAVFSGSYEDYTITKFAAYTIVKDNRVNRNGKDTLIDIELLQFSDRKIKL
ncbi:MAG: hypothetical protein JXB23_13695 [Candidatus Aminicenantes bacterium]|nr:hypothetical protein [Candidatus Aminicenantes bacterium]